ncbi:hypothetical protein [Marinomonas sp. MED121]|uniref:hypothetical protein n=1 Tax=Marinomonas sp. MED121 TaxID=314277 RepID=UPI00103C89EA|nr:hypothetical protein [Marinomonas sp. MED121]
MPYQQQLPCPHCHSVILFDAKLFVSGMRFCCSNPDCHTSISISPSNLEKAKHLVEDFESKKQKILQHSHSH